MPAGQAGAFVPPYSLTFREREKQQEGEYSDKAMLQAW